MKNNIFCLTMILLFSGCSAQMTGVWKKEGYSPDAFNKIAVVAITKNLEARGTLEQQIIKEIRKNHSDFKLVNGLNLFPPSKENWTESEIISILKENDIDGVLTTALIDSYLSEDYNTGDQVYMPNYYGVGRHIYRTYDVIYTPGYYTQSENYVLESDLFSLKEGVDVEKALVWKGQSEVKNPSTISRSAVNYAKNLVKFMEKEGLFNKK